MESKHYSDFYKTNFGQEILLRETEFIGKELRGFKKVLSIGCGPALHEVRLANSNPEIEIIGLDISKDMLVQAQELPTNVDLILSDAEQLCLKNDTIDLVYFLTSLEFIIDVEKTLKEAKRAIKPGGGAIFMVANVNSWYFQKELQEEDSYLKRKYENMDSEKLKGIISKYLSITSIKMMLGIREEEIFDSEDPKWASLFVVNAVKFN